MSPSSTITSPELMPTRNWMRSSWAVASLRAAISRCIATAQATASTTLGNSISNPSPVVLTMRPLCSAIFRSIRSRRNVLRRARVPASSRSIRRLYPATSAARMAASRRSTRSAPKVPSVAAAGGRPAPPVGLQISLCASGRRWIKQARHPLTGARMR